MARALLTTATLLAALVPAGALHAQVSAEAPSPSLSADLRWLGHDRTVDGATRDGVEATVGSEGLTIIWRGDEPINWAETPGASVVVPTADGWTVASTDAVWRFDPTLTLVERADAILVSSCSGADALWWWSDEGLFVDGVLGTTRAGSHPAPAVAASCSHRPGSVAVTWYDDGHADLVAWDGTDTLARDVAFDLTTDPVAVPEGTSWSVQPRVGGLVRSCDTFDGRGNPLPCREPALDGTVRELPRQLRPTWLARADDAIAVADATGWTVIGGERARRRAPAGWRTYALVSGARIEVVGCAATQRGASVEVRTLGGDVVSALDVPTGSCPERAWSDGRRAVATTDDALLTWDPVARTWRGEPRGAAVFATGSWGPLGHRYEVRDAWSASCGAHREVWLVGTTRSQRVDTGDACGDWAHIETRWSDDGPLALAAVGPESRVELGPARPAADERSCGMPDVGRAAPWPAHCGDVVDHHGATIHATTHGAWLRATDDRVWLARALRPFGVLVDGDVFWAQGLPRANAWWRDAPRAILRADAPID